MNNLTTRLQIGTIAMLVLTAGALTMNTCAMDRLEKQVILNRHAVETLENSGLGGGMMSMASGQTSAGVPGTGTGMTAAGWGDEVRPSATWAAATVVASFAAEAPSELSVAQGTPRRIVGMACACVRVQVG